MIEMAGHVEFVLQQSPLAGVPGHLGHDCLDRHPLSGGRVDSLPDLAVTAHAHLSAERQASEVFGDL